MSFDTPSALSGEQTAAGRTTQIENFLSLKVTGLSLSGGHPLLKALTLAIAVIAAADVTAAGADPLRRGAPGFVQMPPLEALGCYFHRGRRHCGRYCYWEVNGMRYCQERERDAFPQAYDDYVGGPAIEPQYRLPPQVYK